jgi:putative transcriptional regulator
MAQIDLAPEGLVPGAGLRLLRLAPGFTAPRHTHLGSEVTLVLQGEFSDHQGRYRRGDVCFADPSVDHRPSVGGEAVCLCLVYQEGPLRLTGPLGRWLNPFVNL